MPKLTIAKLMKEYRKSGKIGRVSPIDEDEAREIADAMVRKFNDSPQPKRGKS